MLLKLSLDYFILKEQLKYMGKLFKLYRARTVNNGARATVDRLMENHITVID